jgi:hypothetical protein
MNRVESTALSTNPYLFVVGCPRSGTTLLQRMLDSHPQLCVANDTHFITRSIKKILRKQANPSLTPDMVKLVASYRRFYRMGLDQEAVQEASRGCQSYAQFVSCLYDLRGAAQNKPLSGEKTPDYCRQIPTLHRLFPHARFVHIIRDGRNTALSTLSWATSAKGPGKWSLWDQDRVGTCALWWRWQTEAGQKHGSALGEALYHEVKYEGLVANPARELQSLARFLEIPYEQAMVNFHLGKTRHKPGLSAKSAWLPAVTGLRDWNKDMENQDVAVFEAIAGDLLEHNAYTRSPESTDTIVQNRVNRCLTWWRTQKK